jgi:hypothetical protein
MKMHYLLLMFIVFLSSNCSAMTGTVVDSETGKPLEGAIVLVECTKTSGKWIGLRSKDLYKVIEKVTGNKGQFFIPRILNPSVDPPRVTVYKKGYVAWNNEYIFPNWERRKGFEWKEGIIIKLETFSQTFSRADHVYFLHNVTHWGKLMKEAYRWEELEKKK